MQISNLRIAVCASDELTGDRIARVLRAAGHELVAAERSAERLIESACQSDPQIIVLAPAFEPFSPAPEIGMLRARLRNVRIVLVGNAHTGRPVRKLVLKLADALV